ncbi:DNA-dependent ATPase mgs1 [Saitoella coloradoensis]
MDGGAGESALEMVECPVCSVQVPMERINHHLDRECKVPGPETSPVKTEQDEDAQEAAPVPRSPTSMRNEMGASPFFRRPSGQLKLRKNPSIPQAQARPPPPPPAVPAKDTEEHPRKRFKISDAAEAAMPLAERVRPTSLDSYLGQPELLSLLRPLILSDKIPSLILWGPSGTGKTTLARIIAKSTESKFLEISATSVTVAECRKIFEESANLLKFGKRTYVFVDEVHRFNKAQQDVFLPQVERGTITLIGATTENPSFKVNNALLSRCRVFILKPLSQPAVFAILTRALSLLPPDSIRHKLNPEVIEYIAGLADGDARTSLNILDLILSLPSDIPPTIEMVRSALKRTSHVYDRVGDAHYDTISAFHKSVRGSDVNATLYYLGRMLESGEDPLYVARRMIRIASEDVGIADNHALTLAISAQSAVKEIGMPECDVILAHCATYLARAPKSVAVYKSYKRVVAHLRSTPGAASAQIPLHIRNAPTRLMKEVGYGKGYKYNPGFVGGEVVQEYLPEELRGTVFWKEREEGLDVDEEVWGNFEEEEDGGEDEVEEVKTEAMEEDLYS